MSLFYKFIKTGFRFLVKSYCKHGIRFSDAESVLFDPMALNMAAQGEQRFVSIGVDATGRLHVVVLSYRGEEIRLISARPATAKEREYYES